MNDWQKVLGYLKEKVNEQSYQAKPVLTGGSDRSSPGTGSGRT